MEIDRDIQTYRLIIIIIIQFIKMLLLEVKQNKQKTYNVI